MNKLKFAAARWLPTLATLLLCQRQLQANAQEIFGSAADHNSPGHYAFEVAPRLEPPSVRRPPYFASAASCGGLAPSTDFLPNDTLCGDLNKGLIPQNPLEQLFDGQPYPFELIKNKTLHFLARALPVLKAEYESIPKVARFLPHQMLNPTAQASPLSHSQLHALNSQVALGVEPGDAMLELANSLAPPFLASFGSAPSRRKRALAHHNNNNKGSSLRDDLNVTVLSSAHSAGAVQTHFYPARQRVVASNLQQAPLLQQQQQPLASLSVDTTLVVRDERGRHPPATPTASASASAPTTTTTTTSSAAPTPTTTRQPSVQLKLKSNRLDPASNAQLATATSALSRRQHPTGKPSGVATNRLDEHSTKQKQSGKAKDSGGQPATEARHAHSSGQHAAQKTASAVESASPQPAGARNQTQVAASDKQATSRPRPRQPSCNDLGNAYQTIICQAAAALIEGERAPSWLTLVKHLGNVYSAGGDNSALSAPNSWWWPAVGQLMLQEPLGAPNALAKKSGDSSQSSLRQTLLSVLWPLSSLFSPASANVDRSDSSPRHSQQQQQLAAVSLGSLATPFLAGIASRALQYFVPYGRSLGAATAAAAAATAEQQTFQKRKKTFDRRDTLVDTPASLAAAAAIKGRSETSPTSLKQPTPCQSVEEYISPTFARNYQGAWKYVVQIPHHGYFTQTVQRTSCLKSKCELMDGACHESARWVSLLVAEIYYPNAVFRPQPLISAAANSVPEMQAATLVALHQTGRQQAPTAASSSLQQSFAAASAAAASPPVQQLQPLAPQLPAATRQQQQQPASDPLHMTDSLASYSYQLNSAFAQAASELGIDPTNVAGMQKLANAYNYQLLQRNGLATDSSPQRRQAGVSQPSFASAIATPQSTPTSAINEHIQQQQAGTDQLAALVAEIIRQNPAMSVAEALQAIHSSNLSLSRRKRAADDGQPTPPFKSSAPSQSPVYQSLDAQPPTLDASQRPMSAEFSNQQPPVLQQQQQQQHQTQQPAAAGEASQGEQTECDGHDKIGCYVVRVYYDWFLVNGSCKCWKTSPASSPSSLSSSSSTSAAANSLLRRIFVGKNRDSN